MKSALRHELGATIPHAGNSRERETGGWRLQVPVLDAAKCTACALCYLYCPDDSILLEGAKAVGIDLAHCKGCGICARECGSGALSMRAVEKE
jgi:pyruvate ferredoxin oxidoreductase delta subunit